MKTLSLVMLTTLTLFATTVFASNFTPNKPSSTTMVDQTDRAEPNVVTISITQVIYTSPNSVQIKQLLVKPKHPNSVNLTTQLKSQKVDTTEKSESNLPSLMTYPNRDNTQYAVNQSEALNYLQYQPNDIENTRTNISEGSYQHKSNSLLEKSLKQSRQYMF